MAIPQHLQSLGYALDTDAMAFGLLEDSSLLLSSPQELRERMARDGYLYLPKFLAEDLVQQVRNEIAIALAHEDSLDPRYSIQKCIAQPNKFMNFRPDLVFKSSSLQKLLYKDRLMSFFKMFLGGEVKHFDYTWLRAVTKGLSTFPHTDSVYMNRGTEEVYTVWTPLGNVTWELGGLIILEGSHLLKNIRNGYGKKDVNRYCTNKSNSQLYITGKKYWSGALTKNPYSLRARYGGRWLGANFQMGDVVIFNIFTVHGSLNNQTNEIRLSTDSRYQLAKDPIDERWLGVNPPGHSLISKQGVLC